MSATKGEERDRLATTQLVIIAVWEGSGQRFPSEADVDDMWRVGQQIRPNFRCHRNNDSTKVSASNGWRSSRASPTPTNLTGKFIVWRTATTTPPFAVPSSLVRITPVQPMLLVKTSAWRIAFWPLVASMTSKTSCGAPGDQPLDDVADLLELAHQVRLGMKPARGVDDQDVDVAGQCPLAGIVGHAGRIGPRRPFDDLAAGSIGPDRELVGGGRAKRVASGQEDRISLILEILRTAWRSRLSCPSR